MQLANRMPQGKAPCQREKVRRSTEAAPPAAQIARMVGRSNKIYLRGALGRAGLAGEATEQVDANASQGLENYKKHG